MPYDRDFNNVLAIWTAFSGVMDDVVGVDYDTTVYSVAYNLTNIAYIGPETVAGGQTLSVTLSVQTGYSLPDALKSVSMDGVLLTAGLDYSYNSSTGEISIPAVSGDVIVTAEAELAGSFAFVLNFAGEVSLTYSIRKLTCSSVGYINWGDGTITREQSGQPSHTYAERTTYTVVIVGDITDLSFANGNQSGWQTTNALYRVLTQFPVTMCENADMSYRFCNCMSLVSIPTDTFYNCVAAEDFSYCFSGCTSLTIPDGVFRYNTAALNFTGLFSYCRTGLTTLPAGLFDTNINATSFYRCFYACESLQSIPDGLFRYNTAAVNFGGCFFQCLGITSIPSGLFATNSAAKDFSECFAVCRNLAAIPAGLFHSNTAATTFKNCFNNNHSITSIPASLFSTNTQVTSFAYCFISCRKLESIPSGLFDNNTLVTTFEQCFKSESSLDKTALTSVPADLFANNLLVTNFKSCFYYGRKIVGTLPELWTTHSSADGTDCFYYCRSASNYSSVPIQWR